MNIKTIAADPDRTKENEYLEKLNSFDDVLAQRDYLLSTLVKIVTETMDYPPVRPSSADSWIPRELVSEAQAAIASVRGNPVPTCQDLNT